MALIDGYLMPGTLKKNQSSTQTTPAANPNPNQNTAPTGTNPFSVNTQDIIPDAGVYGAESAAALNAYNNAIAQATATRNTLYHQSGLLNSGQVDPNNPFGQYQQLLSQQAAQYMADQENAAGRGLRGGLAHKAESADRVNSGFQNFRFQRGVNQIASNYASQKQQALSTRQAAEAQAYNDALNTALQNMLARLQAGQYDYSSGGDSGGNSNNSYPSQNAQPFKALPLPIANRSKRLQKQLAKGL